MTKTARLESARAGFSRIKVTDALRKKADENLTRWLTEGAFSEAWPQIESLIERENFSALFDAFFQEIPFGTGGRRGPVGYGTNRINPFTIATSCEGHSAFIKQRFARQAQHSVVIAYDVRIFNDIRGIYDTKRPNPLLGMTSKAFAKIAASVYAANGIRVWMPDPSKERYISTPELSFAIRYLKAQGGLNVSASHNHPDDNGAKVYNDRGSQEIPPTDEEMARIVEATKEAKTMAFEEAVSRGLVQWIPDEVAEAYLEMNARVSKVPTARSARVVFTPLHGTGFSSAGESLRRAGFTVDAYPAQSSPDGTFSHVPFRTPNPEVRESLLGAMEYARERGADLVLGTDPDADRLGMMAPRGKEWVFLNGNEIGVILAHYLLKNLKGQAARGRERFAVTTVVTSSLFGRITRASGIRTIDHLCVGFKYIADVLNNVESSGQYKDMHATLDDFVMAMEESHGYLVVPCIRDKDAAGAAVLLAEIASLLKAEGKSFSDYLDEIYLEFGYVRNFLVSTVMLGAQGFLNIRRIQESLRTKPPGIVAGRKVLGIEDRWDERGPFGKIVSETDRMSRDMLIFQLEKDARMVLRPSGTESKNKIYVEVVSSPLGKSASREALAADKKRIDGEAGEIGRAFTKEMLSRIDVSLPEHAYEVSDLVPLEYKIEFAEKFLPELVARLQKGERGKDLDSWIDGRLKPYGSDGRLLVAPAVHAYLQTAGLPTQISGWLEAAFPIRKS